MRRYLIVALLLIILLALILWAISTYIQPFLPTSINNSLLFFVAILVGIIGVLAGIKDITELVNYIRLGGNKDALAGDDRLEKHYKLQTGWLEDDLHELISWYHSGVVLYLETLNESLSKSHYQKAKELMPEILKRAHTTVNELRIIHTSLHSRILEEEELSDALRELTSVWAKRASPLDKNELRIVAQCPKDIRLPKSISGPLLRIATSALTNAIFHSGILEDQSISIKITAEKTKNQLILRVIDDGVGATEIIEGYGISRMTSLVRQLNNDGVVSFLELETKRGKGTSVILRIAL